MTYEQHAVDVNCKVKYWDTSCETLRLVEDESPHVRKVECAWDLIIQGSAVLSRSISVVEHSPSRSTMLRILPRHLDSTPSARYRVSANTVVSYASTLDQAKDRSTRGWCYTGREKDEDCATYIFL